LREDGQGGISAGKVGLDESKLVKVARSGVSKKKQWRGDRPRWYIPRGDGRASKKQKNTRGFSLGAVDEKGEKENREAIVNSKKAKKRQWGGPGEKGGNQKVCAALGG